MSALFDFFFFFFENVRIFSFFECFFEFEKKMKIPVIIFSQNKFFRIQSKSFSDDKQRQQRKKKRQESTTKKKNNLNVKSGIRTHADVMSICIFKLTNQLESQLEIHIDKQEIQWELQEFYVISCLS